MLESRKPSSVRPEQTGQKSVGWVMSLAAIGYIRCSTEGQLREGATMDTQRARIRAWAEATGTELLSVHEDGALSGARADNRPGLQAAIAEACAKKAALVVYSLSRLCRSTRDAIAISEKLDKAGADLVSLSEKLDTSSAAGKMIFRMLAVLAEFEKDQIAERTRNVLAHKRAKGELTGALPYGFSLAADGVALLEVPAEQEVLARIARLRDDGFSERQIVAKLNRAGAPTKCGGVWTRSSLRSVLATQARRLVAA